MLSFTELLTASDSDLVRIFYKVKSDTKDEFIIRINKIAAQLELNHTQLICALGFNKHIRDLTDIHSILGFRSFKVLDYRNEELFSTDTYNQLGIDNVLDIYSERLEDEETLATLRRLLRPRLKHIEEDIRKNQDPGHIMSYRMEIHAIYGSGIADQDFADERIKQNIGEQRIISGELKLILDANYQAPSNLFFLDSITPEEKGFLIDEFDIRQDMIKNRLQNTHISEEERFILEDRM